MSTKKLGRRVRQGSLYLNTINTCTYLIPPITLYHVSNNCTPKYSAFQATFKIFNTFFFYSVPIASPGNVVAITTAPTSVNVCWDQLPNTARNGMVIAHEVKYSWPLGNDQLGTIYVNTSGTSNQVVLNRLQECVQYNISVRAYTSQGPGPFSEAVCDSSLNRKLMIMNTKMIYSFNIMGTHSLSSGSTTTRSST